MKGKIIAIAVLLIVAAVIAWYMLKGKVNTSSTDNISSSNPTGGALVNGVDPRVPGFKGALLKADDGVTYWFDAINSDGTVDKSARFK